MDFRSNPQPAARPAVPTVAGSAGKHEDKEDKKRDGGSGGKWVRLLLVVVIFGVAVLLAAVAIAFARSNDNESKFIDSKKYQAVFLNNGQVYFGKVSSMNGKYVQLSDIYYLTQNTSTDKNGNTTTDGNYTLVKLGCQQIHDPYDQMVINRDQVTFWENLQDDGKVVKSIKQFKQQNPNGPDCSQVSNQTQASSNTGTQGGNNSNNNNNSSNSSNNGSTSGH